TQLVPRSEGGLGTKVYDVLVDHPSLAGNDGSVRLKFLYPVGADAFYDPSIADTWVLTVPDDTQAPDVSAVVAPGRPGDAGWYRSPVTVAVRAADNRDGAPTVETGEPTGPGWQAYADPVALTGEGRHELSYRATDAAGNRSTTSVLE
ncbi:hypothetical protein HN247_18830, partial [Acinetobacter baumannii]|uniref:OmpL47-type beta-barrel domain-containing protein n=1 Tax=Acinetobacter baumannii TaxID=470 RepID=UPI0018E07018